ncbi:MAG TPA: ribonuclease III domain-containing protein [Candidatus Sulfotelmatobacter sp.]|nr:ribonuclease III domain-containing protein [Candidatus Sulfotelmatobacter sp.]
MAEPRPAPGHAVETALGYRFRDAQLLALALSSPDAPEAEAVLTRQRLRFLGDAVWNFAVTAVVVMRWPLATAGELTRRRSIWSRSSGLARLARQIGLPRPASLAEPPSDRALAERLEALLGAVFEDGGLEAIRAIAERAVAGQAALEGPPVDAKSALQMLVQGQRGRLPAYRLVSRRGPSHRPTFRIAVTLDTGGQALTAEGEGANRQAAEQEAARRMLDLLQASAHYIS